MSKGGTLKLQGENIYPNAYYKVGDIFITTNEENPANRFGGTWQKLPNETFLMTASSTYPVKSTGGENKHTLTVEEMPNHIHNVFGQTSGGSNSALARVNSTGMWDGGKVSATGGGQPHNNMPKFYAVYVWIRIA